MRLRRIGPAAVTLFLSLAGSAAALWMLQPQAIPTLMAAAGALALVLLLLHIASRAARQRQARRFGGSLVKLGAQPASADPDAPFDPAPWRHRPWYLVLGEGGSGKTTLVERLASHDGDADTAAPARWTLEPRSIQVAFARLAAFIEWSADRDPAKPSAAAASLLETLRKHRPRRPLSGIILTLRADSLLDAAPSEMSRHAELIAAALAPIRDALKVRLPVYIVLTGADRLPGLSPFAEALALDPRQILGWTNPFPLDQALSPESIRAAITALHASLIDRRREAVSAACVSLNPGARPLDAVDALYTFPDSLGRLAAPLATALAFPAGSGSTARAPFLRGIYLTAAPPSAPPAFLHDLLHVKILPERRLVTPRAAVSAAYRRSRDLVAASVIAAVCLTTAVAYIGAIFHRDGLASQTEFWQDIAARLARNPRSLNPLTSGLPQEPSIHLRAARLAHADLAHAFLIPPETRTKLAELRRDAARSLLVASFLRPAVEAATLHVEASDTASWDSTHTAALVQLVYLQTLANAPIPRNAGHQTFLDLPALLGSQSLSVAEIHDLQTALNELFPPEQWGPAAAALVGPDLKTILRDAVQVFADSWSDPAATRGRAHQLVALRDALLAFDAADTAMLVASPGDYTLSVWRDRLASLTAAADALESAARPLSDALDKPVDVLLSTSAVDLLASANTEFEQLRAALEALRKTDRDPIDTDALDEAQAELHDRASSLQASLAANFRELIAAHLSRPSPDDPRPFRPRAEIYRAALSALSPASSRKVTLASLKSTLDAAASAAAAATTKIDAAASDAPEDRRLQAAASSVRALIAVAERPVAAALSLEALAPVPSDPAEFNGFLDALAITTPLPSLPRPSLPMTSGDGLPFHPRYHPKLASQLLSGAGAAIRTLQAADPAALASARPALDALAAYTDDYIAYWSRTVIETDAAPRPGEWPEALTRLRALRPPQVNAQWRALLNTVQSALAVIPAEMRRDEAVASARTRILAELADLERPWFDDACRRARDNWLALGADPARARDVLLRLPAQRFAADYLEIYTEGARGVCYWNELLHACLVSLADAAQPVTREAADRILAVTRAFPLCADADPAYALTPAQLAQARRAAPAMFRSALEAVPDRRDRTIAQGGRTDFQRINDQIVRLAAGDILLSEQGDGLAARLRAVLAFLDERPQDCEIIVLDPAAQARPPMADALPAPPLLALELVRDDRSVSHRLTLDVPGPSGHSFPMPGPAVEFCLHAEPDAQPVATLGLSAPWNAVALLNLPGARIDDDADHEGRLVQIPIIYNDALGQKRFYWIGLRFQRPPPDLTQWPERDDWPAP